MKVYLTIILVALITLGLRYLPFLIFKEGKIPSDITKLGNDLPPAIMILLVIYCLKHINILNFNNGLPEIISVIIVVFLHYYKRNMLLSIFIGTAVYMILIQLVFV